ncbi:hypothetical protein ASPBRDRAFT_192729 [Aspergillus brasiliensis CBS 101740]|uniref:RING-type domain-containing protein n=1 Tax=Aspergillus brasiliensis (strain CBS 101740 / IMI 381727 / IBT 21946) TaxID=767769 RepID=A0A1L9UY14_ASPBC|nr:hypothetical protein ASPBRDRAFT_192729 [Aspergillus brasiliensis CBS 101740]
MAVADQPSGLMDIASSLTQDEIPFKLRCAMCNKLAVNAFRLPCCDQAICEHCQASLPETCPVCAHTPISPDLCKPNKALRTTLKAFLRTEEKKREKERQSTTPATPATTNGATTADGTPAQLETPAVSSAPEVLAPAVSAPTETVDAPPAETAPPTDAGDLNAQSALGATDEVPAEARAQDDQSASVPPDPQNDAGDVEHDGSGEDNGADEAKTDQANDDEAAQGPGAGTMFPNGMGFGMGAGMFPNMAWNNNGGFNPMAQFMNNGMFNFPNAMGMPGMAMDPVAANQGMFGGYGMNMNGMNMGMSFDAGQGMYGGWDGSQNNMWNGGQDKFNPNAFANGMGPQFGGPSGFGGYNMSQPNGVHAQMQPQQFPSQDYPNGSYAGHGRGAFRGRGRGGFAGGRGGFGGHMQANHPANANYPDFPNHNPPSDGQDGVSGDMSGELSTEANKEGADENAPSGDVSSAQDAPAGDDAAPAAAENMGENGESDPINRDSTQELPGQEDNQLRGIPTIDSLDQVHAAQSMSGGSMGMSGPMGHGFGRGGYMRGPFPGARPGGFNGPPFMTGPNMYPEPRGQGVEGAPAAPRAMREGLPNTSILRQRNFPGRSSVTPMRLEASQSVTPTPGQEDQRPQSVSRSKSRARSASRSRSRSPPSRSDSRRRYRERSPSVNRAAEESERRRDRPRRPRREDKYEEPLTAEDGHRVRSPSLESRRSTHRRDRERDRRSGRRSHRSHRHRSWSRSPSRNGDAAGPDHLSSKAEEKEPRNKVSDAVDRSYRSGKDRSSRRDEDRERDRDRDRDRDSRRRERNRDRDRYRERDRDRDRDRDRERDRDRDRHRERDRERDRDRKRSRRDRSESPVNSEYSFRQSRRARRDRDEDKPSAAAAAEPEKDPHTLEREARNRERMLKEQQRREAMHADRDGGKSSRKRDSRAMAGGRRFSYKYEDEENDDARAARVEKEREAGRWK